MKICPMCGSDVLGGGDVKTCSSCGADLEETKPSHQQSSDDRTAPPASTSSSIFNDAPIAKSDDLEVVSSGHAFWAEARRDEEKTEEEKTEKVHKSEDTEQSESDDDTQRINAQKPAIATVTEPKKDAPSLSDLARQRRERLAREAAERQEQENAAAADTNTNADTDTDTVTATDKDHESTPGDTDATGKVEVHRGDSVPTLAGLTDSQTSLPSAHKALSDRLDDPEPIDDTKATEAETPAKDCDTTKTEDDSATDDDNDKVIKVVTQAPQIAYFDGNMITVPGPHLENGATMLISGRPYELKRALAKRWLNPERTMLAVAGLAAGILLSLIVSAFSGSPDSIMFGAVRDSNTGQLLPGVTISIDELNETVQTDPLGMFHIEGVEGGVYTLSGSDPIYGVVNSRVSVAGDMTSVLLDLAKPSQTAAALPPETQSSQKTASARKEPPKEKPAKKTVSPGQVAIAASVSNAEIYLDGRLLGVGNGVYDNIKTGEHTLLVRRDGYKSWEQKISVAGGETARFEPSLVPKDDIAAVEMNAEQYYERGRQELNKNNYAKAIADFSSALNIERDPRFFAWRAEANLAIGNVVRAERDYIDAIDGFDAAQEFSRLDQLYDRAIQALGSSAEIWFSRAEYTYRRSKYAASVRSYQKAMEFGADAKPCWTGIGLAEYARGNFQQASDAWTEADELGSRLDIRIAGYLALASAWLQYRTSCRNAVRRVEAEPEILDEFRRHPDWEKVQRLTGIG